MLLLISGQLNCLLSGSYKPLPYSGVKKCKWENCTEIFVDAVDALKHIKDTHLKLSQKKTKDEVSVLHKQLDNKQDQDSEDKPQINATRKESIIKNEHSDKEVVTSSSDPLQNQNLLLQQKVLLHQISS